MKPSNPRGAPSTSIEKIWDDHVVADLGDDLFLVWIDRILVHERGGGIALRSLSEAGRRVRAKESVFATLDHVIDTFPGRTGATQVPHGEEFVRTLRRGAADQGVRLFDLDDERQGIVHVISPAQGIALPGCTIVCNDSHTCTVGGVGALGWGTGSSELEHALATQTLVLGKPKTMRLTIDGTPPESITAKDIVLHLIGTIGAGGGNGYTVELAGAAVRGMSTEERLTLCNMIVELGARSGLVAPDDTTFASLDRKVFAPQGAAWDDAVAYWRTLVTDPGAVFAKELTLDCRELAPQLTWGTSPEQVAAVDACVPDPAKSAGAVREAMERALVYVGLAAGDALEGTPIDAAFLGSCTTTNRNFEGRQGRAVRSHLASPATVAASAIAGAIADVRRLDVRS